jgi:hypothetical protein
MLRVGNDECSLYVIDVIGSYDREVEVVRVNAMTAYMRSRCLAPLFVNLDVRWKLSGEVHGSVALRRGKNHQCPLNRRLGFEPRTVQPLA